MYIKLPILDLSKVSIDDQVKKICEEHKEWLETPNHSENDLEEILDKIQAEIGYIMKVFSNEEITEGVIKHWAKLEGRERKIIGTISMLELL